MVFGFSLIIYDCIRATSPAARGQERAISAFVVCCGLGSFGFGFGSGLAVPPRPAGTHSGEENADDLRMPY